MVDKGQERAFSEEKHRAMEWHTRTSHVRFGPFRRMAGFVSLKRAGVDHLARQTPAGDLVLDLGCGTGAYAHWYLGRKSASIVAMDWSPTALNRMGPARRGGKVMRVCGDCRYLPFKEERFGAAYTIDMLGHVRERDMVLDELLRVCRGNARLFLHSECSDPLSRWPDSALIAGLGADKVGEIDGHIDVPSSAAIHQMISRRFTIAGFHSPAGYLGWLMGYPEKYGRAFRTARRPILFLVTSLFALMKRLPLVGSLLRVFNAMTNHLEIFLGLEGGGSCFCDACRESRGAVGLGYR